MSMVARMVVAVMSAWVLSSCGTLPQSGVSGHVVDADSTKLRLCFQSSAPGPGTQVQILRRQRLASGKPPASYSMRKVGIAQIDALTQGACASATLTKGMARTRDEVRLSVGPADH